MTHPPAGPSTPPPPPGPKFVRDYLLAYRDSYRWLYRACPPWRWLLSAALIPGSPLRQQMREVAS
ncbi:MAG: hypothetical protein V4515_15070 [Chloroflexota bacterium]